MKKLLILLGFFYCQNIIAQGGNPFMSDVQGKPIQFKTGFILDGSPFLFDDYNFAEITSANGTVYHQIKIKINIVDNEIQYMSDNNKEMIATMSIKKITFPNVVDESQHASSVSVASFGQPMNAAGTAIYQVVDSGKVSLLKKIEISKWEQKKYGDADITRHFDRKQTDYILLPGQEPIKIEKGKAFMLQTLADKKDQVGAYIDQNNIKCKSTTDFEQVISYYNTL